MQSRSLVGLLGVLSLVALVSCNDGGSSTTLYPGQTDFSSDEPANGSWGQRGGNYGELAGADSSKNGAPEAPPSGRTAEVEEADIYKVDGNTLFYLNTYRGFLVYDLQDPQHPRALSHLPVYGYPIEMFIANGVVYALLRDALYLTQVNGQLQFKRHNVSQLVAIDIHDRTHPKLLKTVDIIGELREGVSRKIENTIYVVSYQSASYYWDWNYGQSSSEQKEQAWVYSFNVADARNPRLVNQLKVFEGGGYNTSTDTSYSGRYFQGVTISATSNALMVVENWQTYGSVYNSPYTCGQYTSQQQAIVSLVDISDPQGAIKLHTKFETYGNLGDQFKQTYVYDEAKHRGIYLGIFARQEWQSSDCQGTSLVRNTLESWDVTDGAKPQRLNALAFGKPDETVRGSIFDSARNVVFAITARSMDPLYALSFADPAQLKVLSAVDGLSGDMNVFRPIEDNKFLIAIGRDNSETCTGFGSPTTGWSTNVAVSIIDVQDLAKIRLVQRQCVAVQNAAWVSSELNWNLDQAHKMIGMHSDGKANVITVPVSYYTKAGNGDWWWSNYETAVGVMSWDLSKYDPAKSESEQQVLQNYGTVIHPYGEVKRTVVFTHQGTDAHRKLLNISTTHVSLADIEDLQHPVRQAVIEVAPNEAELYRFGAYLVAHVRPDGWSSSQPMASEFRIKAVGGQLEDAPLAASFQVSGVEQVVPFHDNLIIFRHDYVEQSSGDTKYMTPGETEAVVYSLSDPRKPRMLGAVKVPQLFSYYYPWYWCGSEGFWGGYRFPYYSYYNLSSFTATEQGLAFLSGTWDQSSQRYLSKLLVLDLRDLGSPRLEEHALTSEDEWSYFNLVADSADARGFYLTSRHKYGTSTVEDEAFGRFKYYVQRWSLGSDGWEAGPSINVPGQLIKTWAEGDERVFLTHDSLYHRLAAEKGGGWASTFRLNILRQLGAEEQPLAELRDSRTFDGLYLKDLVRDGNTLYVNARPEYYGGVIATDTASSGVARSALTWDEVSDQLHIFDLSALTFRQLYAAPIGTYEVQLMGIYQGMLFLNLPGDGVLAVNVSNPAQPVGQQFMRTLGYATHIEFAESTAYVAAGNFGIYQMDLKGLPILPYL